MKELTGVFLTDGVSRSGERFTVPALEDMLWLSYRKGNPSNVSHDIHRPIGWSSVSSLYVSHEMTYVLGKMYLPESESEFDEVMRARSNFLNNQIVERINQYSNDFYTELNKAGLLAQEGKLFSNGIVMYGAQDIVYQAFPFLSKTSFDSDGLILLSELKKHFEYKGCGVFAAKKSNFSLLLHPYLRRSLSRFNNFNTGFIDKLLQSDSEVSPVRVRIDDAYIGYTPSYIGNVEFEFWFGPSYSDDIMSIQEGLTTYVPDEIERFYNPVCKTEFLWENKDGKRQFEMEEVVEDEMPTNKGHYGCRYMHSFYDPKTGVFDHFDGAIRIYDEDLMIERKAVNMNQMGHRSHYIKLFRIDGKLQLSNWKGLITQYLKDNSDVYRYFNVEVPFKVETENTVEEKINDYLPQVLHKGDGVRLLLSYQEPIYGNTAFYFSNFDSVTTHSVSGEAADVLVIDLAKSLRRDGIVIENPSCLLMECRDGFVNLPLIAHCGHSLLDDVNRTLNGIRHFLCGLNDYGNEQSYSMGITWNIDEDKSVVVSFMGAVPDLLEWLNSFSTIPIDRDGIRKWFENQVKFIHSHGNDGASPINSTFIQSDGTFFQERRNIQQDVDLKDVKMDGGGFMAEMSYLPGKDKLASFIDSGMISFAPMMVINNLKCEKTGNDYLASPLIAPFGETTCSIGKIESMVFVWCEKC